MVFSSLIFLCVFLPVNFILYFISKNKTYRNCILILTSLFFYAWGEPVWVSLLILTTLFDYINGRLAGKYRGQWQGRAIVTVSVIGNLLILAFFKYSGFIADNINKILGTSIHIVEFGLPIGISFYTFQTISYVVDVYKGEVEAQKSPLKLLLFVSLFHQLVAGPIVRYKDIAEQIDDRVITREGFNYGVGRFITGLGKKVIIANTAGNIARGLLENDYSTLPVFGAWYGIILFAFQIYFDFSGYSDMAIGLGKMFGFTYKENFNYPYISKSATEFWRRWHISLQTFFKDYLYIPLGGNRRFHIRNLAIVWFLTGLWHGASWNFVIWGMYYFALILIEKKFLLKILDKIPAVFSRLYLIIAMLVGWVFFYYTDISKAIGFLGVMFGFKGNPLFNTELAISMQTNLAFTAIAVIGCTPLIKIAYRKTKESIQLNPVGNYALEKLLRPIVNIYILLISIIFLVGQTYNPFLYFRF